MPDRFSAKREEERETIVNRTVGNFLTVRGGAEGTKIVVTGKGGVGKTVISSALSTIFAENGFGVLAVDGDPQMNMAPTLGLSASQIASITPLNEQLDYIEERVGARPNSGWGMFLTLNPNVKDVVSRFGVEVTDRIRLLVMGTLSKAAVGCLCPENTLLEATVNHIALTRNEAVVMDTEAGVEHFGRAIAKGFNHAVVVTDPSHNACSVAAHALRLAHDLRIPGLHLVCNRWRSEDDRQKVVRFMADANLGFDFSFHMIPYEPQVYECDPSIQPVLKGGAGAFVRSLEELFEELRPPLVEALPLTAASSRGQAGVRLVSGPSIGE
ncbi:MAG TPA: AAA family ATPase [Nitrososphaerales archaeon]|nr:AAA family ATPase [Nitrososphaerales archaeon]